jgi:hypothetical protein
MKTQLLILSTTVLLANTNANFTTYVSGNKQAKVVSVQNADFSFFRTHRQSKSDITATWGLISEEGVTGFTVQRTYEDPADPYSYWENIKSVSCDASHSYKYTDENVLAGLINYRIVAQLENGTSVTSEVSTVKIVAH